MIQDNNLCPMAKLKEGLRTSLYTMLSIKNFTHVSTNFMPIWIEIQTWSKHKKGTLTYLFLAEKEINFLSQTPVS